MHGDIGTLLLWDKDLLRMNMKVSNIMWQLQFYQFFTNTKLDTYCNQTKLC